MTTQADRLLKVAEALSDYINHHPRIDHIACENILHFSMELIRQSNDTWMYANPCITVGQRPKPFREPELPS